MKTKRIISILLTTSIMMLALSCSDDDGTTISLTDVSTKVTGYSTEKAGTGAPLTVNGTNLDKVVRIFVGNLGVSAKYFTSVSESSITFTVPPASLIGDNDLLFVFPGSERAFSKIEVIPFQSVSDFVPHSATIGESVTILGSNLDVVTAVKLGSAAATVTLQTPSVIKFTVPSGSVDGPITLVSEAGSSNTSAMTTPDLIICDSPTGVDCSPGLELNGSLELGTADNFDNWGKNNGGAFMSATSNPNEVYRGSRALKVVRDGSLNSGEWRIQFVSDAVATEIGASYTVYVWAKASATGGSFRVSLNPDSGFYPANVDVTTAWQQFSFVVPGEKITTVATKFSFDLNGNNAAKTTFFIDDVRVLKN